MWVRELKNMGNYSYLPARLNGRLQNLQYLGDKHWFNFLSS